MALILVSGIVFQTLPAFAETESFTHSAYNFEYDNLLLDIGDGTYPLLSRTSAYKTADGRNGSVASSDGAVLNPELFSGKDEFTLSFWTKFSSLGSAGVPYSNAKALIEKLNSEISSSDYTKASYAEFSDKTDTLKKLISSSSSASVVAGIENLIDAKNALVKIYSSSEAAEILNDAKTLDLGVYTSSSANAFSSAVTALEGALSSDGVSDKVAELLNAKDALVYTDYSLQAKAELEKFKTRFADIDGEIYTEESYSALTAAISKLESGLSASETELRSYVSAVNSAFSALKPVEDGAVTLFTATSDSESFSVSRKGSSVSVDFSFGDSVSHSVSLTSGFTMITVTVKSSSVSLYVDGTEVEKQSLSSSLSSFGCKSAEFLSSVTVDDIYVASKALTATEVKSLYGNSLETFLREIDPDWVKPSDRIDVTPVENFKWSAYTFDNGLKVDSDLNGVAACMYNATKLVPIETADYDGEYGMGLVRRNGQYPSYYMSLKKGLLSSASSFTVAGFVRNIGNSGTSASFIEFSGKNGKIVLSPFSSAGSYFECTDASGNGKKVSVSSGNVNSKWVHYALTFSADGTATVYVDGKNVSTVSTGMTLTDLSLNSFKIISGITSGEAARLIIDDIYVSSKVMSESDIRKLATYGVERFVGEVLPDPETGETEKEKEEVDLSADETDELEDAFSDTAAINGFIGTTFDDISFMGEDFNGAVAATVRNASLVQGLYKYGLNLNGKTSYVRYPKDIFNSISELTVSIAFNWTTPSSINERNQKLFAFAKKDSSVSDPKTYIYLDMGSGGDAMKLCLSDGNETVEIPLSVPTTGEWQRITVTVNNGRVKVYSNTDLIADKKTGIDLTAISPDFNYIGKSCYKGDPLFCGIVDEIYISDSEISEKEIEDLMSGIAPAVENSEDNEGSGDVWDGILIGTLIFMGLLFAAFIAFIVYTLFFKK